LIAFFDACTIIYRVESVEPYLTKLKASLTALQASGPEIAVSRLSFLECRVLPLRRKQEGTLALYREFFGSTGLRVVEIDAPIVDRATVVRAESNLGTPDALQAASALSLGGDVLFITNDAKFRRVDGLNVELL
jgi:predicted nucleic acid-binding protein